MKRYGEFGRSMLIWIYKDRDLVTFVEVGRLRRIKIGQIGRLHVPLRELLRVCLGRAVRSPPKAVMVKRWRVIAGCACMARLGALNGDYTRVDPRFG